MSARARKGGEKKEREEGDDWGRYKGKRRGEKGGKKKKKGAGSRRAPTFTLTYHSVGRRKGIGREGKRTDKKGKSRGGKKKEKARLSCDPPYPTFLPSHDQRKGGGGGGEKGGRAWGKREREKKKKKKGPRGQAVR